MSDKMPANVFFLGIGGIGMSALARWFSAGGAQVSGYDKTPTALTENLSKEGIRVFYSWDVPDTLHTAEMLVYTPAVPSNHPVFAAAKELKIPVLKRAELLGMLSRTHACLAVAGTHGKTSVTSVLSVLMQESGQQPLAFIGGILKKYNSNFLNGQGKWMIAEADEYDRSFLQLSPMAAVITAIDPDHLDIYGDAAHFTEGFRRFAEKIHPEGSLILEEKLRPFGDTLKNHKIIYYGTEQADVMVSEIRYNGTDTYFRFTYGDTDLKDLKLSIPGRHNVMNAAAAITLALTAGIHPDQIRTALPEFTGVKRRMDIQYNSDGKVYIDDYAHHPEEIKAVLSAVREMFPTHTLRVAFQPHLFSRTRDFCTGFAESLELADELILLDIYPARELPMEGITVKTIGTQIRKYTPQYGTLENLPELMLQSLRKPVVMLTLGAGDIDTCVEKITRKLREAA